MSLSLMNKINEKLFRIVLTGECWGDKIYKMAIVKYYRSIAIFFILWN